MKLNNQHLCRTQKLSAFLYLILGKQLNLFDSHGMTQYTVVFAVLDTTNYYWTKK